MRGLIYLGVIFLIFFSSCESKVEKAKRLAQQERLRIERLEREEAERKGLEEKLEQERIEKELYDKYIDNSLKTGTMPYAYCFGENKPCTVFGCSEIRVVAPKDSDVIVTIKKQNKVFRHGYIEKGDKHSFQLPDGEYQPFFYYGKGWNPEKLLTETDCGPIKGGFVSAEVFGKDEPQNLENSILEYKLILSPLGNFSTKPSDADEIF